MEIVTLNVDGFVRTSVYPELCPVVGMLRELMREMTPGPDEAIRYGIPTWKCKRIFAFMTPSKKDITFSFPRGSEFEDRYGLLKGRGKVSRHVQDQRPRERGQGYTTLLHQAALEFDKR
jgi:hypothetical protein